MKILFLGDIVGRSGRESVVSRLPELRQKLRPDFIIVNGENAAGGYGITREICESLYDEGVDVITLGNHAWDQRDSWGYIDEEKRILRPANYPSNVPGQGAGVYELSDGRKILVIQLMCRLFMDPLDDPFSKLEEILSGRNLGGKDYGGFGLAAIVLDLHGEASSEKQALARFADSRVSAVLGTHTHVPTADNIVLPGGTAYMTDVGMCGPYDSVIGMDPVIAMNRFVRKLPTERLKPVTGDSSICGALIETNDLTGLANSISPVRLGGILDQSIPV